MAESFATGTDLGVVGIDPLATAWDSHIKGGVSQDKINFEGRVKFDVTRGWPLGGAITGYGVPRTGQTINVGSFVMYHSDGTLTPATSPVVATPVKIMCALANATDKDVVSSGKLPVLSSNYRVVTDQLNGAEVAGDFTPGDPVTVNAGKISYVDPAPATTQILGYVISVDSVLGTVEIEVQ